MTMDDVYDTTNKEVIDVTNHVVEQLEAYAEGGI